MKKTLNIGHRGAKGHLPENTLPSFLKAFLQNADGIELDVHLCKTGEVVVMHDFTVDRTTNGTGLVSEISLEDLKKLKVENQFQIPTLQEVVEIVPPGKLINIELKGKNTAEPVLKIIKNTITNHQFSNDDFLISSFDYDELREIFRLNSQLNLGVLTEDDLETAIEVAREILAKAIHPNYTLLTPENIKKITDENFEIFTWTVNEINDIETLKKQNITAIITDFPDRI
ncbi:glycerophosphodiester phosphodiesterase [Flavobacterium sp. NST-5]|uniref:Glycerophosphodiester phosphodiesterase n=1 Tax=Flavobacterium ichthyis TaxID=2698827 RepID=A0ABW9Z9Z7_9FLAO|nr:glycerophosphodiester phosphodiesterase family protein [Flavobacterium ichthyis]NBL64609.1 glycerophosphodiester phosphodiesterase [Flavobacterium ichthyis]